MEIPKGEFISHRTEDRAVELIEKFYHLTASTSLTKKARQIALTKAKTLAIMERETIITNLENLAFNHDSDFSSEIDYQRRLIEAIQNTQI